MRGFMGCWRLVLAAGCVVGLPGLSGAFDFAIEDVNRPGPGRVIQVEGSYRRTSKDERLLYIKVVPIDGRGRDLGFGATGYFDRRTRTWSGGAGDYRMKYYRVDFYVETPWGVFVDSSAVYRY